MRVDPDERRERGLKTSAFFDEILKRARGVPGVTSAALAVNLPLDAPQALTRGARSAPTSPRRARTGPEPP
ncbi:MAG: hypothetical protein KIT09_05780 [Bryobacteraceae bacterium]|nr:hypothetical protein [Bryobacteraceae bacterium]